MLYVLYGSDFEKKAKKLNELVNFFLSKKPDASVSKISSDNFSKYNLEEMARGQGLFSEKSINVIDGILESKENKEFLFDKLDSLKDSPNIFIISERAIGKTDLTALTKKAEKVQEFDAVKIEKKPDFNIFSLADAIGMRDKKRAWTLLLRAFENGMEPEEIHGTVFWQFKNLLAVKNGGGTSAADMGMKPFVYTKAKSFSGNYSKEELENISLKLVSLYHDSHRGRTDFSAGLEQLILSAI